MRMRLKCHRGEKIISLRTGGRVTVLDWNSDTVKVLNENDKLEVVHKSELDLPVINTQDYEKL